MKITLPAFFISSNYYNNDRIKSNLNKMSPIQYRAHYYQN
ncbi:IS3 family transposase [Lutibacter sp. HS1-25]